MPYQFAKNSLQLVKLRQQYHDQVLFSDVSATLTNSDMLLILGNNGSGKSTLLRTLTGLQESTEGAITWNNQPIINNKEYQTQLHYIAHQTGLKPALTVLENIQLLFLLHQSNLPTNAASPRSQRPAGCEHTLQKLSLDKILHTPVRQLSAGQQRRVALAKLLLIAKPIWLLDEPLTALDHATQLLLQEQINQHREQGGIVVVSSHQELAHIKIPPHELRLIS